MENKNVEFALNNIGKSVFFVFGPEKGVNTGMIVGYKGAYVLLSMTNNKGWNLYINDTNTILVHSPLNVSYWYVYPEFILSISQTKVTEDGFTWIIIDKETAHNIFILSEDIEIYKLYDDGSEGLVECLDDIDRHAGQFGVELK